ncbi:MAG: DUF2933 domain-containing protein [Patescibacteria group bacterium]
MLKIGIVIAVPLVIGFLLFPQSRLVIASLAPFALFALCPLALLFGMKAMSGDKNHAGESCSSCGHIQTKKLAQK